MRISHLCLLFATFAASSAVLGPPPLAAQGLAAQQSAQFQPCTRAPRVTCVVDGDTLWLEGIKIRIADINTPEISRPGCAYEARLGARATTRLIALLNAGPFRLAREGRDADRYGRKLRVVMRGGESLGDVLVTEGLAERWTGRRSDWC